MATKRMAPRFLPAPSFGVSSELREAEERKQELETKAIDGLGFCPFGLPEVSKGEPEKPKRTSARPQI